MTFSLSRKLSGYELPAISKWHNVTRYFMTKIASKENRKTIWFSIIFSLLFFTALGTFMIYIFYKMWLNNEVENKTYLMPIFGLLVYFIGFSFAKSYIKNTPKIILDFEKITIKNKTYYWKDIQNMKMTGKKGFGLFNYQMEVTTLKFENNITEYIFDDMYSNSWEIKSFIKQIVVDKKDKFEIYRNKIVEKDIEKENFEKFNGSPIFSFRGIMMWSLILFFLFLIFSTSRKISYINALKFFIPFSLIWFAFNSYCMHYFELSKNYFVVKNHCFWWIKDIYKNSEIEIIVFESQQKQPNSLRVISKDFRRKIYLAGTLNDKKCLEMKIELERKNIKVRNECI
jgi:hypothetical protein